MAIANLAPLTFPDGNILLRSGPTTVTVHQGVLAYHSVVFRNIIKDQPKRVGPQPFLTTVVVEDRSDDLLRYINAVYGINSCSTAPISLQELGSLLRMGRKYAHVGMFEDMSSRVATQYPASLKAWDSANNRLFASIADTRGMEFDLVNLAIANDLYSALPSLLYRICRVYTPAQRQEGVVRADGTKAMLSTEYQLKCAVDCFDLQSWEESKQLQAELAVNNSVKHVSPMYLTYDILLHSVSQQSLPLMISPTSHTVELKRPPTMTLTMRHIPQEITGLVIEELAGETHALRRCSEVSSSFRDFAQAQLFRSITMYLFNDVHRSNENLRAILKNRPRIGEYIHLLKLHIVEAEADAAAIFSELLPMMTMVRSLTFKAYGNVKWACFSNQLKVASLQLLWLPTLSRLEMQFPDFPFPYLGFCTNLKHLVFHHLLYDNPLNIDDTPELQLLSLLSPLGLPNRTANQGHLLSLKMGNSLALRKLHAVTTHVRSKLCLQRIESLNGHVRQSEDFLEINALLALADNTTSPFPTPCLLALRNLTHLQFAIEWRHVLGSFRWMCQVLEAIPSVNSIDTIIINIYRLQHARAVDWGEIDGLLTRQCHQKSLRNVWIEVPHAMELTVLDLMPRLERNGVRLDATFVQKRITWFHSTTTGDYREEGFDNFSFGDIWGLAVTDAFGMGLHMPDVQIVVQYRVPGDLRTLVQRFGRAARAAGSEATAVLLAEKAQFDNDRQKSRAANVSRRASRAKRKASTQGKPPAKRPALAAATNTLLRTTTTAAPSAPVAPAASVDALEASDSDDETLRLDGEVIELEPGVAETDIQALGRRSDEARRASYDYGPSPPKTSNTKQQQHTLELGSALDNYVGLYLHIGMTFYKLRLIRPSQTYQTVIDDFRRHGRGC
ncbi:hypothetical protein FPV67DRAFT_1446335 [Lyophyllum atratum]|nr:hypothetical protein FPV67DRAFT_1446335 [Lyophyllum atratum]